MSILTVILCHFHSLSVLMCIINSRRFLLKSNHQTLQSILGQLLGALIMTVLAVFWRRLTSAGGLCHNKSWCPLTSSSSIRLDFTSSAQGIINSKKLDRFYKICKNVINLQNDPSFWSLRFEPSWWNWTQVSKTKLECLCIVA